MHQYRLATFFACRGEDTLDCGDQILGKSTFWYVTGCAMSECLRGNFFASLRRHQDHGNIGKAILDDRNKFQAIHLRHLEICQHKIRMITLDSCQSLTTVRRFKNLAIHTSFDQPRSKCPVHWRIVYDQHFHHNRLQRAIGSSVRTFHPQTSQNRNNFRSSLDRL